MEKSSIQKCAKLFISITANASAHITAERNGGKNSLRVLLKKPNEQLQELDTATTYGTLSDLVGGNIETIRLDHGIILLVNEDGKSKRLSHNFYMNDDYIVGTVVFTKEHNGHLIPLTNRNITWVGKWLKRQNITISLPWLDSIIEYAKIDLNDPFTVISGENGYIMTYGNIVRAIKKYKILQIRYKSAILNNPKAGLQLVAKQIVRR